jgi:hypothetical protein
MNVTVHLPPEAANKLLEKAAQQGATLEEYLTSMAVHWAKEANGTAGAGTGAEKSTREQAAAWQQWVASHKPGTVIADDSRESIYGERGE